VENSPEYGSRVKDAAHAWQQAGAKKSKRRPQIRMSEIVALEENRLALFPRQGL